MHPSTLILYIEDWYDVTVDDMRLHYASGLVSYHDDSIVNVLKHVYPQVSPSNSNMEVTVHEFSTSGMNGSSCSHLATFGMM
jgi:hypothetical protein